MLLPHSHAWTRRQKWFITGAAALVVAAFTTSVCIYERYYRGPGEDILYGDWEAIDFLAGDTIYFRFRPDQTFTAGDLFEGEFNPFADGRWYAGGPNIYIRFSADDIRAPQRVIVLHIVDVQPHEVHVRLLRDGQVFTFRRATLNSTSASNQAMERTAARRVSTVHMIKPLSLQATLALGGRRSSYSR
jgi:hypothetical protein